MMAWSNGNILLLALCAGNSQVTVEAGDLRCHRTHYDVTVMEQISLGHICLDYKANI